MIALLFSSVLLAQHVAQSWPTVPQLHTHSCSVGAKHLPSTCGTFVVPENRANPGGRMITLHFIIIKAERPSNRAIVFNPGGPGGSSIDDAQGFADSDNTSAFTQLRKSYDLLLLDNRGTGKSAPQNCDFAPPAHPELYFAQMWPDSLVKQCRDHLAANADLSDYSTIAAAGDLDVLRAALGYPKLVLYGGSYGTRFYLAYARQFPGHVQSMILDGVAPPHFEIIPLQMALGAQVAMNATIRECKAESSCEKHFPLLADHFSALLKRFDRGPLQVPIYNSVTKSMQTVALSKEVFVDRLRQALYFSSKAAYVPVIIERAYHGDYAPLSTLVDQTTRLFTGIQADGLNLSVTCAEDIPFITEDAIKRVSAHSFEGDLRIRAQQRACEIWNVKPVPASFVEPVRSDAPILMINGANDPASPISSAREALPYLPNARMLVIKGGSHDSPRPPCTDALIVAFVKADSAQGLQLNRCGQSYTRPAFATLAPYESAPGENVALTVRFRKLLQQMMAGHIDRSQLEPAVSKMFSPDEEKSFAAQVAGLGPIEGFIYNGSHPSPKGTTYVYMVHFNSMDAIGSFTLDNRGKISDLDVSPG